MLNTEEQPNDSRYAAQTQPEVTSGVPASADTAATRVSAEEFTAAIQALEQRKADEARRYANTVDVGKTIQELNIDATPEEVMREVQAQRAARIAPSLAGVPPHSQLTDAQAATREQLRGASVMLKDYYDKNISPTRVQVGVPEQRQLERQRGRRAGRRAGWGMVVGAVAVMAYFVTGSNHFTGIFSGSDGSVAQHLNASTIKLSNLNEGDTAYVDTAGLTKIYASAGAVNSIDQNIVLSTDKDNSSWSVTKKGGKLYLEGFTRPMKTGDLSSGLVHVFSQDNGGDLQGSSDDAVTIPITGSRLTGSNSGENWSEIMVDHIQVDSNTNVDD